MHFVLLLSLQVPLQKEADIIQPIREPIKRRRAIAIVLAVVQAMKESMGTLKTMENMSLRIRGQQKIPHNIIISVLKEITTHTRINMELKKQPH